MVSGCALRLREEPSDSAARERVAVHFTKTDPRKLSGYFVQKSSGPLAEGTTVKWKFAESPDETDVVVRKVIRNERIVFEWPAMEGGYNTKVEMVFKPLDAQNTMVQISESGWRDDAKGRQSHPRH